jgi:hypothetical protein
MRWLGPSLATATVAVIGLIVAGYGEVACIDWDRTDPNGYGHGSCPTLTSDTFSATVIILPAAAVFVIAIVSKGRLTLWAAGAAIFVELLILGSILG